MIEIDAVKGKQKFYKLIKDGKCEFDEFEANAIISYRKDVYKIYAYMDIIARLQSLDRTKFNEITTKKEVIKEYEFKSGKLRVYLFKTLNGKIIVSGGFKNTQKQDIEHFRQIKKMYLSEEK